MPADRLEISDGVEAFDQDHGRSRIQRQAENHVEPEDVEQGQDAEADVGRVLGPTGVRLHLLEVGQQVAVRQHRRLR